MIGRGLFVFASICAASAVAIAAPPVVKILPQNAGSHCSATKPCTQPTVDGVVAEVEYADGRSFPLQDYVNGGPNGELVMTVSDTPAYPSTSCNSGPPGSPDLAVPQTNPCRNQTLFLGLKIARPTNNLGQFIASSGTVVVWLDALRNDTLTNVAGANVPRAEDRMLIVSYSTSGAVTATIAQYVGTGGLWAPLGNMFAGWPMQKAVSIPISDPAHIHVEIAVGLHPILAGMSEPLISKVLGLGVQVLPAAGGAGLPATIGGGIFPNNRFAPPQNFATASWATLDFSNPPPIPMSFTTWNVGQMPSPIANGGSANSTEIAEAVFAKDTVCLEEVWIAGEREDIVSHVNLIRANHHLPPMNAVYEVNDEVFRTPTGSTGLILLTAHPILSSAIHHFPHEECTSWDCLQHKGVVWARVGLPSGAPIAGSGPPTTGFDNSEFMDVFCSHVDANDVDDAVIRNAQFEDIRFFMHTIRAGGPITTPPNPDDDQLPLGTWPSGLDRPAVLLGDMNTPGPHGFANGQPIMTKDWGDAGAYNTMMANLGVDKPTQFDLTNSIFSDMRDLNMTVAGPLPAASGTWVDSICNGGFTTPQLADQIRYDYALIVPPADTDSLPAYALAEPDPTASVDAHFLGNPSFTCLSDHAEVDVSLGLVRVADKLQFNPMKRHRVEFEVMHLIDLASGGCCADWYTPQILITSPTLGTQQTAFLDYNAFEGQEVSPLWNVASGPGSGLPDLPPGFQGRVSSTFQLWEHDVGPDDHYDSIPEGGNGGSNDDLDIHLTYFANTGNISRVAGAGANWTVPLEVLSNVFMGPTDVSRAWTGNNQDTGDNAVVSVRFVITEL